MKMEWFKLSIWIGTYGFLKEYRPEDPYITNYLRTLNFTLTEVNQDIFPVATYVSLSELIVVFLLTDWLRYKPVIVLHAISGVMMQVILIWYPSKMFMYVMEFCYGTMVACEVAYYTYIYAKVDKRHYQIVTSHMRAASLSGRFISSLTSHLLLQFGVLSMKELNHLTLFGMSFALIWALTLPPVKTSMYFHRTNSAINFSECSKTNTGHTTITCISSIETEQPVLNRVCGDNVVISRLWADFKHAYTNPYVLKWSLWWAVATCGYTLYTTYVQSLWMTITGQNSTMSEKDTDNPSIDNGLVEAVYTLISALVAFCFGYVKADWKIYGELLLGVCTLTSGFLIYWSSRMTEILPAYIVYVLFGMLYQVMMTVSNSEVARNIHSDSYALIFGVNGFVALVLQSVLTVVLTGRGGFLLPTRTQFMIYGMYFIVLGIIFCLKALFGRISNSLQYTIS